MLWLAGACSPVVTRSDLGQQEEAVECPIYRGLELLSWKETSLKVKVIFLGLFLPHLWRAEAYGFCPTTCTALLHLIPPNVPPHHKSTVLTEQRCGHWADVSGATPGPLPLRSCSWHPSSRIPRTASLQSSQGHACWALPPPSAWQRQSSIMECLGEGLLGTCWEQEAMGYRGVHLRNSSNSSSGEEGQQEAQAIWFFFFFLAYATLATPSHK